MRDQVRAIGRGGEIAAGKLVLALRSSFDDGEAVRNGEIDGLVVANLEVQVAVLLERVGIRFNSTTALRLNRKQIFQQQMAC